MENNIKSKITVIGFVVFVMVIYTGSYFYTKSNNERLLSAPRVVLLIGDDTQVNIDFKNLNIDQRREEIRTMLRLGMIYSLSQSQFDSGTTDIVEYLADRNIGDRYVVANCQDYSATIKKTMEVVAKAKLKTSWIFYACGI